MIDEDYKNKCKNLCKKYGYNYINQRSWGIYTRTAREMGFNNGKDEFENVENYFISRKQKEKEELEFLNKIEECKSVCNKYNFPYKNNITIINYRTSAKKT